MEHKLSDTQALTIQVLADRQYDAMTRFQRAISEQVEMIRVGADLPAGEYKVEQRDDGLWILPVKGEDGE